MIRASLGRHPGKARMMVAKRPRHGFAMIRAKLGRHPGGARMMVALRPRHGGFAAMIIHNMTNVKNSWNIIEFY
jgi:hypothetical protein